MSKLPAASPWPTNTIWSVAASDRATNGFSTGSVKVPVVYGAHSTQLRAVPVISPVPSAPSSVGAIRLSPPSIVVVWYHRLSGSLLHAWSGGCTSMEYVAGPRLLISTKPSVAGLLDVLQMPPQSGS